MPLDVRARLINVGLLPPSGTVLPDGTVNAQRYYKNGVDLNTGGTLSNVVYKDQIPVFSAQPRCKVYSTAVTSLTSGAWTAIAFDSEEEDTASLHSTSVNTSRITVPVAGTYWFYGCIAIAGAAAGQRGARFFKNGTTLYQGEVVGPAPTAATRVLAGTALKLALNDYVELQGFQDSGAPLNANAGIDQTSFGCFLISG